MSSHNQNCMQPVNPPKKTFMVKPRVGCVKTSTYDLPTDQNHVYGYVKPPDEMRCGEIMSSWVAADPSAGKVGTRSYVHSNILAIRNGCINASSMRQYIDQHPNIRLKEEAQDNMNSKGNHEGPFGVQTKFADESMKALMQGEYTNFADDDTDYPDTSNIMKMSSFPMPISTKASELLMSKRRQEKEKSETPTKHFCMKKFQGVESKLFKELNLTPTRKIKGKNGATQSQSPTKFQNSVEQFRVSNPDLLSPPMV